MTRLVLLPESMFSSQIPFVPPQMLEDLLAVGEASGEEIDRLAQDLEQEFGVPTDSRLEELINRYFTRAPLAESILRAIVNVRPEGIEDMIRTLDRWRKASSENSASLTTERLKSIHDRLSRLIRNYPVMVRYRKAQRLRKLSGRMLKSVEMICDLRPLFDQTRTVVEGLIPLTTLRVAYQSGEESGVLEVLLTEDDLDDLVREVETTKNLKLPSLRKSVGGWIPHGWIVPE